MPIPLSTGERIILYAMMVSVLALAIDIMLPALGAVGEDLSVSDASDLQWVVTSIFAGFAVGQLLVGPVSDRWGRRPVIVIGYCVFLTGCALSLFANSFELMIAGRVLQGLGGAAPRVLVMAMVRDRESGRPMARIMSTIMAVFITVPVVAPILGQGLISVFHWRSTFVALLMLGATTFLWFVLRHPETLPPGQRRAFSLGTLAQGLGEIGRDRDAVFCTIGLGCVFGCFIGYLGLSQPIFQSVFSVGNWFAGYFALGAAALGAGSYLNARIVERIGMKRLILYALTIMLAGSLLYLGRALILEERAGLVIFVVWLTVIMFSLGLFFGNANSLAMLPLGHMAGLGAAFVGSVSTVIAIPIAWVIGQQFQGGATPLAMGFAVSSMVAIGVFRAVREDESLPG